MVGLRLLERDGKPVDRAPREERPARRLLVVDDTRSARHVVAAMLRSDPDSDWTIVEASCAAECFTAMVISPQPFDAILLDVQLPDLDGISACRALRRLDPHVPVVFLTANRSADGYREGREAGGDSYLVKPVGRVTLKTALDTLVNLRRPA